MKNYRFRVNFSKTGVIRFTSHHDLMRLLEMAFRRSDLPIAYSEGYNPRPRLSFPTALALGMESFDEYFDAEFSTWCPPVEVQKRLQAQFPKGMSIISIQPISDSEVGQLESLVYHVELPEYAPITDEKIAEFMALTDFTLQRSSPKGSKNVNVRSFVRSVKRSGDRSFEIELLVSPSGTAKPLEVLIALGIEPSHLAGAKIVKAKSVFQATAPKAPARRQSYHRKKFRK